MLKQPLTSKFKQMEMIPFPFFSSFGRKIPTAHNKMASHCMTIKFIILIPEYL